MCGGCWPSGRCEQNRSPIVLKLVPSAIENVLSFSPGSCHACRALHEQLKSALMQYLLATTNLYVHGEVIAQPRIKNVEESLADAMKEFESHRQDTHFANYFTMPWTGLPVRNAS
jgi:hypothetical protein